MSSTEAKLEILLEAVDKASAVFRTASDNIQGSMNRVETAQENVATATKASTVSNTNMLLATNNLASGCSNLVNSVLSVERAQFMVEKAHLAVNRATASAEKAQETYNEAVSKYGEDSAQATDAADKLAIAQEALSVAQDRAGIVQNSLNQAMVSAALNVIPTLISTVNAATTIMSSFMTATEMASLAMDAIPFVAVAAGIAALGVVMYSWIGLSNKAAEAEKAFNDMMVKHEATMNVQIITWDDLDAAINRYTADLNVLQSALDGLIAEQAAAAASSAEATAYYESTHDGLTGVTRDENEYAKSIDDRLARTRAGIKVIQDELAQLNESRRVHDLFFSTVTSRSDAYKTAVNNLAASFKHDFGNMTSLTIEDTEKQKAAIQAVALLFGCTWEEVFQDLTDSMAKVPETIDQKLVGEAQAKFEAFKNCISGKALTIGTDVVGAMSDMADNVTNLIHDGFVGEAQNEMQAYADCSTNKVNDMVQKISGNGGYIDELTKQHDEKIKTLTEAAANAYGSEKDAILAMIDAENSGYKTRMGTFAVWLSGLYEQLLAQADSTLSRVDAIVGGARAAMATVKGDLAASTAIMQDVWKQTGQVSDVLKLAQERAGMATSIGSTASSVVGSSYVSPDQLDAMYKYQHPPRLAEGGIVTKPTFAFIGESGPEAVIPLSNRGSAQVSGPTVNVYINDSLIDRPMVDVIKNEVKKVLDNVIVEPSSSSGSSTHKRIRGGSLF